MEIFEACWPQYLLKALGDFYPYTYFLFEHFCRADKGCLCRVEQVEVVGYTFVCSYRL